MVRMADFFKKETPEEESKEIRKEAEPPKEVIKENSAPQVAPQKIPIKEIQKETSPITKPADNLSIKDASLVMREKMKPFSAEEAEKLYQDSLALIKAILEEGLKNQPIEVQKIKEHVEKLVDQLSLGNSALISLANNFTPENYLYSHSVNVCILSLLLGIGIGYSREQLGELGVASFLHDIGMVKLADITQKPGRLTEEEYRKIKDHPVFGVDMLEKVKNISKAAIYVAQEHHEWANGKGYPKGLKGEQIDEYAKIVATADTYEALTHPRAYREKLQPFEAIKDILRNKEHFDPKLLKILIEKIGIFPLGSWVQLSTNEIGVVLDVNKNFPLKPTVRVVFDQQEKKLAEEKVINLTQFPNIYIKKPVSVNEAELNK